MTDEVLNQLAIKDALTEEFCTISLNAISGTAEGDAMRLKSLVQNKTMLILEDSGSSHTFVSPHFLARTGIAVVPARPRQVKLANGDQMVPKLEWWIHGFSFSTDMAVIGMGGYDAILAFDWLTAHCRINHHWANRPWSS